MVHPGERRGKQSRADDRPLVPAVDASRWPYQHGCRKATHEHETRTSQTCWHISVVGGVDCCEGIGNDNRNEEKRSNQGVAMSWHLLQSHVRRPSYSPHILNLVYSLLLAQLKAKFIGDAAALAECVLSLVVLLGDALVAQPRWVA
jgi:hypothetical protein